MVLSAVLPCLGSIGNGAMWARFVDQTVDHSADCLQNGNILRVALHQVTLIGLNFCFLNHLGYISLASPVVGGLCLVPIFLVVFCGGQAAQSTRARKRCSWVQTYKEVRDSNVAWDKARVGLGMILRANVCVSIAVAALFALSGFIVFSITFGMLLAVSELDRKGYLSRFSHIVAWQGKFVIANIAALLIGAWYHRLRATFDILLRARNFYAVRQETEPICAKREPFVGLTTENLDKVIANLVPSGTHFDVPSIIPPQEVPKGLEIGNFIQFANTVFTVAHVDRIFDGFGANDEHLDRESCFKRIEFVSGDIANSSEIAPGVIGIEKSGKVFLHEEAKNSPWVREIYPNEGVYGLLKADVVLAKAQDKLQAWIAAVSQDDEKYRETRHCAFWCLNQLKDREPGDQAHYLARLTWNVSSTFTGCDRGHIDVAQEVYSELTSPSISTNKQRIACILQEIRRQILQDFIAAISRGELIGSHQGVEYYFARAVALIAPWSINWQERHIRNNFLFVLRQMGMRLGLPEEEHAKLDFFYRGSITELIAWWYMAYFKDWFSKRYTADLAANVIRNDGRWNQQFLNETLQPWVRKFDPVDMAASVSYSAQEIQDERLLIKDEYCKALLVLTEAFSPETWLQESERSW